MLEFEILNRVYPGGKTSYNAIAEIPGTDKRDEVIMLGGHLDSWHAATGATDNAIGCAVMMEAARILKALGIQPRRTIRVALWSGEEQGLLGSQAYVKEHFGSFENPKNGYEKFGGYFNVDSGTGRIRGASVFGPPEAAEMLRQILEPFKSEGVIGAIQSRSRNLGGSDNTSFNQAGLPGIGLFQDPIEYGSHTWHTNLDTIERIVEDDVKKNAVLVATAVYALAMSDSLLPRYSKEAMPPPPPPEPTTTPTPTPQPTKPTAVKPKPKKPTKRG
jgi:Zn-dependent M28 family amino/carboxypeptidase